MKYAVLADIHGNFPALQLAVQDALANGAQGFLLAGDYAISAPWPCETADLLRSLPNARLVCGNEERYLHVPDGDDGQFAVSRACRDALGPQRIAWFDSLPEELRFHDSGVQVSIAHSSDTFIGQAELGRFSTMQVCLRYGTRKIAREQLLNDIRASLQCDSELAQRLPGMQGVYIFGHTHCQWHAYLGDVLLLNPGSCGLALDCGEFGACYSLLSIENGRAHVEERRVPYDVEGLIGRMRQTQLYARSRVWCEVICGELRGCREQVMFFLHYAEHFAREKGDSRRPFARETWEEAFVQWDALGRPAFTGKSEGEL